LWVWLRGDTSISCTTNNLRGEVPRKVVVWSAVVTIFVSTVFQTTNTSISIQVTYLVNDRTVVTDVTPGDKKKKAFLNVIRNALIVEVSGFAIALLLPLSSNQ
jgi:hypothetical protein